MITHAPTDTLEQPVVTDDPASAGQGTSGRRRGVVVVVGLLALVAGAVGLEAWQPWASGSTSSAAVPYDDPQAAGLITLCGADGTAVTGGSLSDRPFAAAAVGETGVPGELDPAGAVGTLFAYQPRLGIGADEFSGTAMTAATVLSDPARPAVAIDAGGWSVGDFTTAFPATHEGFVQLRIYLGTPQVGTLTENAYDVADLRVDGDRWELVRGGDASCADAVPAP